MILGVGDCSGSSSNWTGRDHEETLLRVAGGIPGGRRAPQHASGRGQRSWCARQAQPWCIAVGCATSCLFLDSGTDEASSPDSAIAAVLRSSSQPECCPPRRYRLGAFRASSPTLGAGSRLRHRDFRSVGGPLFGERTGFCLTGQRLCKLFGHRHKHRERERRLHGGSLRQYRRPRGTLVWKALGLRAGVPRWPATAGNLPGQGDLGEQSMAQNR
jgi:hypothetical protein